MDKGIYGISKAFDKAISDFAKLNERIEYLYKRYEAIRDGKEVPNVK